MPTIPDRIQIPYGSALQLRGGYFRVRVLEQVRSISLALLYLPSNALKDLL